MVVQIVSVVAAILAHAWNYWPIPGVTWIFPVDVIAHFAIWFMVALSLVSAVDYFWGFWSKIDTKATKARRRRSFVLSRRKKRDVTSTQTS
jgi:CDP-diacylglycerol--glycerol-3-phosphate 3-phosphatidyltransferase